MRLLAAWVYPIHGDWSLLLSAFWAGNDLLQKPGVSFFDNASTVDASLLRFWPDALQPAPLLPLTDGPRFCEMAVA